MEKSKPIGCLFISNGNKWSIHFNEIKRIGFKKYPDNHTLCKKYIRIFVAYKNADKELLTIIMQMSQLEQATKRALSISITHREARVAVSTFYGYDFKKIGVNIPPMFPQLLSFGSINLKQLEIKK